MSFQTLKKFNVSLALALCAATLLCGCGVSDKVTVPEYSAVEGGYVAEQTLLSADGTEADWVGENMQLMLSNDQALLYLGKYYDVALVDRRTGAVAYSNEAAYLSGSENYSQDQQKNAYSQLVIDYFRKDGAAITVHSFPECYDGAEKQQIETETVGNVLRVKYSFGTVMESRVIFQVMTGETYKQITEAAEKAVDEKKISASGWGRMKSCYNHIVYDELSDSDRKRYTETYPSFKSGDELYVLNPSATYIQTDNIEVVCKELGYTRADVDAEEEKVGGSASLESTIPNFVITLEYSLDNADLLVNVNMSEIVEPESFYINRIYVLPFFGATATDTDGYLLLPDGTGSIVSNSKQSDGSDQMRITFYGSDPATDVRTEDELSESAAFPVFGLKSGETAVFGIVESNDAMAGLDAGIANNNRPMNTVMPWVMYRIQGSISEGENSTAKNAVYSQKIATQPYTVRYHLLYGERSTYSGMASYYREYLLATEKLPDDKNSEFSVDVSLIGGLTAQKNILGISTTATAAASDFDSAGDWLEELDNDSISLNYEGIFNSGIESAAPAKLKLVKALGEREEYDDLNAVTAVWPALSFMQVSRGGNGISGTSDIAKFISKEYAFTADYEPHTGLRSEELHKFLITPAEYCSVAEGMTLQLQEYSKQLYLTDAASLLTSDFNENRNVTREDSKLIICKALADIKNTGISLKLGGANAYALRYADALTDVPSERGKLRLADTAIPFVGMVLHGSLSYSVSPLNEAGDYNTAILDMLEMGANPSFRLITGDMSLLSDTEYTEFYGASANVWSGHINELAQRIGAFYKAVSDESIESHEITANGFICVRYSNGYSTVINRSADAAEYNGSRVEASSYLLLNEKGEEI